VTVGVGGVGGVGGGGVGGDGFGWGVGRGVGGLVGLGVGAGGTGGLGVGLRVRSLLGQPHLFRSRSHLRLLKRCLQQYRAGRFEQNCLQDVTRRHGQFFLAQNLFLIMRLLLHRWGLED